MLNCTEINFFKTKINKKGGQRKKCDGEREKQTIDKTEIPDNLL